MCMHACVCVSFIYLFAVLVIEPRSLYVLGKHFATELHFFECVRMCVGVCVICMCRSEITLNVFLDGSLLYIINFFSQLGVVVYAFNLSTQRAQGDGPL